LGNRTDIDHIEVRWPSGQTQKIENPPVDHILVIKEGGGWWLETVSERPGQAEVEFNPLTTNNEPLSYVDVA
jgi:hypothetical protein